MKKLILFKLLFLFPFLSLATPVFQTQESSFEFMYSSSEQTSLLYSSKNIILRTFLDELNCTNIKVDTKVTAEMVDYNFVQNLMGEKDSAARFSVEIKADCPSNFSDLQTYLSFKFQYDDIPIVFYVSYFDELLKKDVSYAMVDELMYQPYKDFEFTGSTHCGGDDSGSKNDWSLEPNKYSKLIEGFCN